MPSGATAAISLERLHGLLDPGYVLLGWAALTLAALSLLWVVQRRAVNRSGDTLCGSCGYNVQGLTGHTCPECGGDLRRRDGILRPGWPYSTEALARLIQWTILLPLAGLTVSGLVAIFLELRGTQRSLSLNPPRDQPGSVHLGATGEGYRRPVRMDRVSVELMNYRTPRQLNVEVDANTLRYREPGVSRKWSQRELDGGVLAEWLSRAGLDGTSPDGRADAEELAALIRSIGGDREWYPRPARFRVRTMDTPSESRRQDPRFRVASAGFWAAVWLAGTVWLLKRRPGSRRHPAQP
jgi:predicted RNA-binding Zn-ribbon protein involved in translation (DUF1610 family)